MAKTKLKTAVYFTFFLWSLACHTTGHLEAVFPIVRLPHGAF